MLKLLFTLESPQLPALHVLHYQVLQELDKAEGNIQLLADTILESSRRLIASGELNHNQLIITLHKVRSTEWNTLLIRYRNFPNYYQCEIKKEKSQISLPK